jgi:hypothetical protein
MIYVRIISSREGSFLHCPELYVMLATPNVLNITCYYLTLRLYFRSRWSLAPSACGLVRSPRAGVAVRCTRRPARWAGRHIRGTSLVAPCPCRMVLWRGLCCICGTEGRAPCRVSSRVRAGSATVRCTASYSPRTYCTTRAVLVRRRCGIRRGGRDIPWEP